MRDKSVGRPMEILLVEDSLTQGTFTLSALRQGDVLHRLTWVTDGQDALDFLHRRGKYALAPPPDMVLLDLGLPVIDGREVLKRIKGDEKLKSIPVVVLTASDDPADLDLTQRLDAAAYIIKPVDLQKFLGVVHELKDFWHSDMILPTQGSAL